MSFQTHKTFVHLCNTNYDIFYEIQELSDPPSEGNATPTFKVQKSRKDIIKIVHVTTVVQPSFFEATRILFVKTKKTTLFFIKLRLNHVTWTILMMSLLPFWALNISVALLSMQGQKALRYNQKYLNLCSEDEWRSYRFGTTWGWVINDRI